MSATRKASGQNLGGLAQSHSAMGHLSQEKAIHNVLTVLIRSSISREIDDLMKIVRTR